MKKDEMKALQEVFKNDCTVIDFAEEYPGFTGSPRYMISTRMTQEDLEQRYGPLLDSLRPYIYDSGPMGEAIARYKKNEQKHWKRKKRKDRGFYYSVDEDFDEHHPECCDDGGIGNWELSDQLKEAMILLSPLQRRRLILVYAHKFTLEEVARAEGVSTTAIFHSNTKALNKTRKNYKGG